MQHKAFNVYMYDLTYKASYTCTLYIVGNNEKKIYQILSILLLCTDKQLFIIIENNPSKVTISNQNV